jgi:hypothetical protein
MIRMVRRLEATMALAVALGALTVACSSGVTNRSVSGVPSPSVNSALADAISPGLDHDYVFERGKPAVGFQPGSTQLVGLVKDTSGLHVAALRSTEDSSAVLLVEDDQKVAWGTHLLPAERSIFKRFAATPTLGNWLILITDVVVLEKKDPIPLTAYRWSRADVETYVDCGIPDSGQNDCSTTFFRIAKTVVLAKPGGPPRGA